MLGIESNLSDMNWDQAIDWSVPVVHPSSSYEPLFKRLDVDEIVKEEQSYVESQEDSHDLTHSVKGGKKEKKSMKNEAPEGIEYLDFETFMEVELRVGRIMSVEDHPNADRLYVVTLDDGSEQGRTICAGIKAYYATDELLN